ncbi:hypothetical protein QYF36_009956 [Acer negundo]|nr:hypothetical protein QYF36_009956 [Acer negundo]
MVALGNLMCYISKENDHARDNNQSESISRRNVAHHLAGSYKEIGEHKANYRIMFGLPCPFQSSKHKIGYGGTFIQGNIINSVEDKNMIYSLVSLIERRSEVLKGKALLFVAFLCKNEKRCMLHFLWNARLLPIVYSLEEEMDSFVQQCLDVYVHVMVSIIPGLLDTITRDVQQKMGGRRHREISTHTNRAAPKTNLHLFPIILHLLGSSSFKNRVALNFVLYLISHLGEPLLKSCESSILIGVR